MASSSGRTDMSVDDETVVLFPISGKVFHRADLNTIGVPMSSDPEWFRAEDYAYPQCRRERKGKLTSRSLAEQYGHPPCRRCYPNHV